MKTTPRFVLAAAALVIAWVGAAPLLRAAEERKGGPRSEKSDGRGSPADSEALRKYDRNGNGKLDPDEEAAMKADREKAKTEQRKKGG